MSDTDYKIPKIETKVEILVDQKNQKSEKYILFLNEYSRYQKGQETLYEFLNKGRDFIPLKNPANREFFILNINDILYLKEQKKSQEPQSLKKVILYLKNNVELELNHFKPLPDSQSRVLDYLNGKNQFVVFIQKDRKIFVNKKKILKVKEY